MFPFNSREVRQLLLELDSYGDTDLFACTIPFFKRTTDVVAHRLNVVFRRLLRLDGFPACWIRANVTATSKGLPSFSVMAYNRLISVKPNVFERLVSVILGRVMECRGVVPTTKERKGHK